MTAADLGLVVSVFFASAVEFVEALTIVLAMGVTRGWRSALAGAATALVALAAVAALAGYALAEWLPEALLQLVIGTLLLIFGLQWLRKAILRSAGLKALNDEDEVYRAGHLGGVLLVRDPAAPRVIRAFLRFWRDFIVGDDWRIAAGVTAVLAVGAVLVASEAVSDDVVVPLVGLGIVVVAGLITISGRD